MIIRLLSLLLWVQGLPGAPQQYGAVTGVVKTEAGTPAVGVRVAAMAPPDNLAAAGSSYAMASIAETDDMGRYRLEGIPVGRYYIVVGRLDLPTYYPGAIDIASGTLVTVPAGKTAPDINVVMRATSVRTQPIATAFAARAVLVMPEVRVENGGKIPVMGPNGVVTLRLTRTSDGAQTEESLNSSMTFSMDPSGVTSYRLSVERLPEGYTVKSMKHGLTELMTDDRKIDPARSVNTNSFSPTNTSLAFVFSSTFTLSVTLAAVPTAVPAQGVRVTGQLKSPDIRPVFLSGSPGIVFADHTFEFRNVPPGRHLITSLGNRTSPVALAALIVVSDRDVNGVEMSETPMLPLDFAIPVPPRPAGNHPPGSVRLASFRGRFVESDTQLPITEGTVYLVGDRNARTELDADGRFEFSRLLPGRYDLEAQIPGYRTLQQTIVVDDSDVNLGWSLP